MNRRGRGERSEGTRIFTAGPFEPYIGVSKGEVRGLKFEVKGRRILNNYCKTAFIFGASMSDHFLYSVPEGWRPSLAMSEGLVAASLVEGVISV
jgi:hypothetical protein